MEQSGSEETLNEQAAEERAEAAAKQEKEEAEKHLKFAGSNLGFALAGAHFLGDPLVTKARLDPDGRVQVVETLSRDVRPAVLYSILPWTWKNDRVGLGPLVVASPGLTEGQVPVAFGAGLILSVASSDRGSSVGVGLVYALDARVPTLREDFIPGEMAPMVMDEAMEPQFVKRTRSTLMLVVSYSPARKKNGGGK